MSSAVTRKCRVSPTSATTERSAPPHCVGRTMSGLLAYGAYLPYHRLQRKAVAATLGARGGSGTRTVASYDEDTTSLGVEAARAALRGSAARRRPTRVRSQAALLRHDGAGLPGQDQCHGHPRRPGTGRIRARGRHDRFGAVWRGGAAGRERGDGADAGRAVGHPHRPSRWRGRA